MASVEGDVLFIAEGEGCGGRGRSRKPPVGVVFLLEGAMESKRSMLFVTEVDTEQDH